MPRITSPSSMEIALACKKTYLTPFRDYPANHLTQASPKEAAQFIASYVTAHVFRSPLFEKMHGMNADSASTSVKERRMQLSILNNEDAFRMYCHDVAANRTGNCFDMCAVAILALKEFGYPHKVEIVQFEGRGETIVDGLSSEYFSDHALVRISGRQGEEVWWADPFATLFSLNEIPRAVMRTQNVTSSFPQSNGDEALVVVNTNWGYRVTTAKERHVTLPGVDAKPLVRLGYAEDGHFWMSKGF